MRHTAQTSGFSLILHCELNRSFLCVFFRVSSSSWASLLSLRSLCAIGINIFRKFRRCLRSACHLIFCLNGGSRVAFTHDILMSRIFRDSRHSRIKPLTE